MLKKCKVNFCKVSPTVFLLLISGIIAENLLMKPVFGQNLDYENISFEAKDLLTKEEQMLAQELDLEQFCQSFPLNSRCVNVEIKPTETPKIEETTETPKIEETSENEPKIKEKKEKSGWAITPEISTLGLGASVTRYLNDYTNLKLGINGFGLTVDDIADRDIDYEGEVNLFNVSTLVEYQPFKKFGMRLVGGLVINDNNIKTTAIPKNNAEYEINGVTYSTDQIKSLKGEVTFSNSIAPYLGLGFGNAVKRGKGLGFSLNLGVMFAGSPEVTLTPEYGNIPLGLQQEINNNINQEIKDIEDDIEEYNIYPVLSLGVSYQF